MDKYFDPKKKDRFNPTRRGFMKAAATATGGLVIAYTLPLGRQESLLNLASGAPISASPSDGKSAQPNAFIQIAPDNTITMIINKLEMGQGVNTSLAQLLAEELECDWSQIRAISAPVAPVYNHTHFGMQMTGGSTALASSWDQHRQAGAAAREMLISAAAKKWGVDRSSCRAENGHITHPTLGKLTYGELATAASALEAPKNIQLKSPKNFKIIGKSMGRVDARDKSTGQAIFGIDVRVEGMLYAVLARPPVFGAKLKSVNDRKARSQRDVVQVVRMENSVAVLAKTTFSARQGRDALELEWDFDGKDKISSESLLADFKALSEKPGAKARDTGDAEKALARSKRKIEAEYEFPFLAHACMEPMNCTIDFDGKRAKVWAGHQMPTADHGAISKILCLSPDKVELVTTYAGGSFGRRANKNCDYAVEAAKLAAIVKKPLKIVWTREDDMKGGYYRPMNFHQVSIGLDAKGGAQAWKHTIVGPSVVGDSVFEPMMVKNGVDPTVVEGIADSPYSISNFKVEVHLPKTNVPVLWWRSVGHSHTAFVMETLIDELAASANEDALHFRKRLLKRSPRHLAVLELLAKKSPWGKKAPKGHAYGLAIHESFNSVVGHVVEVSKAGTQIKIHRVVSAVHCGQVVNPAGAKSQIESAIVYGLSAALYGEITLNEGKVMQNNFHDYGVLRMNEMPIVEAHFVETSEAPTGLGEPGLPPIAPAVANALFRLTGKRIRRLPFKNV